MYSGCNSCVTGTAHLMWCFLVAGVKNGGVPCYVTAEQPLWSNTWKPKMTVIHEAHPECIKMKHKKTTDCFQW